MKDNMKNLTMTYMPGLWAVLLLAIVCAGQVMDCASREGTASPGGVDEVLDKLQTTVQSLRDYQAEIEYAFEQPLLESKTLRRGRVMYRRSQKASNLRVNFETLKQDEQQAEPYREYFIFDGVWLTHIDYQVKSVQKRQLAEADKPMDAFDLARGSMPIIGFSATEDLRKEFTIELVTSASAAPQEDMIQLHLTVKPGSAYEQDYQAIDFWIDKQLHLPVRVDALTTEEDVYRIRFLRPKVNKGIADGMFEVEVPTDFGAPEIIPLDANS